MIGVVALSMSKETTCVAKFVSKKISKIRWQILSNQVVQHATIFATGTWDDAENTISIWRLTDEPQDNINTNSLQDYSACAEPNLVCEAKHIGDVTDLAFLSAELILAASSTGSVNVYKHYDKQKSLSVGWGWNQLHHYNGRQECACTALAVRNDDTFVSIGQDGRIQLMRLDQRQPISSIDNADSCSLNAVSFLTQAEVAVVNSIGQLKVWDLRKNGDQPVKTFLPTAERVSLSCVDKHPTQPHLLTTGAEDGTLSIWDMRQDKFPVSLLSAHSADMWEVRFHPTEPDNLFSCSEDGSLWHWDGRSRNALTNTTLKKDAVDDGTAGAASLWLGSEASKHRVQITDLLSGNSMPVNSIDVHEGVVLAGTDAEQIYVINNALAKGAG